jgi:carbon starvation protein
MSNQLLAASGLIIGTTMIIRMNKVRYAWITAIPGIAMALVTLLAGYQSIRDNYLPKGKYLLAGMAMVVTVLMVLVFAEAFVRWFQLLRVKRPVKDAYSQAVLAIVPE